MTNQFDAQLDKALDSVRDMLPESVLLRLEAKLRQIHAERPDLAIYSVTSHLPSAVRPLRG